MPQIRQVPPGRHDRAELLATSPGQEDVVHVIGGSDDQDHSEDPMQITSQILRHAQIRQPLHPPGLGEAKGETCDHQHHEGHRQQQVLNDLRPIKS